jgi:hypothetical protein
VSEPPAARGVTGPPYLRMDEDFLEMGMVPNSSFKSLVPPSDGGGRANPHEF